MFRNSHVMTLLSPALLLLSLAGCGLTGPAHSDKSTDAAAVVDMGFASFEPVDVHIKAGQSVEWRNTSLITHTVTDDRSLASDQSHAVVPAGAVPFASGDIPAGEVYRHAFAKPGTYTYFCTHHEDDDMVGTIVVDPAS